MHVVVHVHDIVPQCRSAMPQSDQTRRQYKDNSNTVDSRLQCS